MASHFTNKEPIVCLSTQDFNDLWTRKQRFMRRFAKQGHPVLYVETQYHLLTYLKNLPSQWRRLFACVKKPREVEPGLFIATPPLLLPFFQMLTPLAVINNIVIGLWLKWMAKTLRFKDPMVYTYVVYSYLAIRLLGSKKVLYEKVDDLAAAKGLVRKSAVDKLERRLLKLARLVIVTAAKLKTKLENKHDNVHLIPNACDLEHFAQTNRVRLPDIRITAIPKPRLGFVGVLAYWINLDLLEYIARQRPDWQIVIIGPVKVNVSCLQKYDNIHFLGRVPYEKLPACMAGIDLFLNPYKLDDVAASCSPLKVFEYLAAGKPVVSTPMPEVLRFAPAVRIAAEYNAFIKCIDELLALTPAEKKRLSRQLRELVKGDNWDRRFQQTQQLIKETFPP